MAKINCKISLQGVTGMVDGVTGSKGIKLITINTYMNLYLLRFISTKLVKSLFVIPPIFNIKDYIEQFSYHSWRVAYEN